jgi:hypothetical protein
MELAHGDTRRIEIVSPTKVIVNEHPRLGQSGHLL